MTLISKETFLKANDAKNRDALLFDMLESIDEKLNSLSGFKNDLKTDIEECKERVIFLRGAGVALFTLFSSILAWLGLK